MIRKIPITRMALACTIVATLAAHPALADKPEWAGKGKGRDREGDRRGHFEERHRVTVRDYYDKEYRSGHCPPGLAKKHNGCMPPGQAKRWTVGRPLPRDVVYYDVPPPLVVQIGAPPAGYRYVRVAADILLIAAGTGMVVDAIQDLGRR